MIAVCQAFQFFLSDLKGHHVLIHSDSMSVVSYINHQGGLSSKRLCLLAKRLLEWAQPHLCSLRAAHIPGKFNQGADELSRSNVPSEEWTFHPQMVQIIWDIFGEAEVDLFASGDDSHCLTYYSKVEDALAHEWPNLLLYLLPLITLIPQVIRRIKERGHKVLLVASLWKNQPWLSELTQLLIAATWLIPLRRDLLCGLLAHSRTSSVFYLRSLSASFQHYVGNLDVTFDSLLNFEKQISTVVKGSFFHLRSIVRLKQSLPHKDLETVIHAFVTSRLDYCNSLYCRLPPIAISHLQVVQNAAARLLAGTKKRDHISPIQACLHWIPVKFRVEYINDLLIPYSHQRAFRSNNQILLTVLRFCRKT